MSDADLVVQTEHLTEEAAAWLGRRCRLVVCRHDDPQLAGVLGDAAGLVVRTYTVVDEVMLDAAPRLRVVGRAGAGLDNIDVAACRSRGVEVVYTPDANTQAVVEYVVSLLAGVLRPGLALAEPVDRDRWRRLRAQKPDRPQMNELTLGILGLGRIGRRLAEVARAIGFARVLFNDLLEIPPTRRHGAVPVAVERLFAQSDVVNIHIDGRPANRHFVGLDLIGRMKPDVIFVNTSRGFVVDSLSLATFLEAHPHALALLDVHEREPFDETYPLLGLPNGRLYPHAGASTERADLNMSWVVRDVVAVLEGRRPEYPAPLG
ncbi:MAG: NAD(P)-dependent oxidoreductase [Planctomycetota bacterium]